MSATTLSTTNTIDLSVKYQQKNELEHVLDRPDSHIGSVEHVQTDMWIYNANEMEMIGSAKEEDENTDENMDKKTRPIIIKKNIEYIPGLFKLFDECIINCRDHVVRMNSHISAGKINCIPVTYISVKFDESANVGQSGTITMINDGAGIDIAMHPTLGVWIPELIFGHLRSSTNYDDKDKNDEVALQLKIKEEGKYYGLWGGKNGLGIKLVFIWSTFGSIETVDHVRGLKYYQEFRNNLSEIGKPVITKCTANIAKKPYTKITFCPDYARLQLPQRLDGDMMALLKKRVYDISAMTDKNVKVKLNDQLIPIKNFSQYIDLYIGDKTETPRCYEASGSRWEYAVALSPDAEFTHVSFVNGIHTHKGGKHVDYIIDQITTKLKKYIEQKNKKLVKLSSIKEQLILFVRCDILFPAFDSQTKDFLNTPASKFGSSCVVSDSFIKKVADMGVMSAACAISDAKEKKMEKKTDGSKKKHISGIPNFDDANWAGTEKSNKCALILTEGLSAKAGVISGLSAEDKNKYGVLALKGKLENIRKPNVKIKEEGEIANIKKIIGLAEGMTYPDMDSVFKNLRYSRIIILPDQDLDGSHIKGLFFNVIHHKWPSLCQIPGFITFMNTPILKATKGCVQLAFYNQGEYDAWSQSTTIQPQLHLWKIKYYKGLGTSVGKEWKEYLSNPKIVSMINSGLECDDAIDIMFNKTRSNDRKLLLKNYKSNVYLNTSLPTATYTDFIHNEMLHFSKYDCDRSIPNVLDGLKPSLRKVLYSAFKRNLTTEIKVAQLAGYVSEHSAYHHGELSLTGTIINMSQNYVGSNNINLLFPAGQFGTRCGGGKDAASPRYIFTRLETITRFIFVESDLPLLEYLEDDGDKIEPKYYVPIIPFLLVNGAAGIGTGFSTDIPCYNPLKIIGFLKEYLAAETDKDNTEFLAPQELNEWIPYYHGFRGNVVPMGAHNFTYKGMYHKTNIADTICVTELPIGVWTNNFKTQLEEKEKDGIIKTFTSLSTDTTIHFTITFPHGDLERLINTPVIGKADCNKLEHLLGLYTTNATTNMSAFDKNQQLQYYSVATIFEEFIPVRKDMYVKRKANLIKEARERLVELYNRSKFIREIYDDLVDLRKKTPSQVTSMLELRKYDKIDGKYKYLTQMQMDSVTEERSALIFNKYTQEKEVLDVLEKTTPNQMWMNDLNNLENAYDNYVKERDADDTPSINTNNVPKNANTKKKATKTKTTKTKTTKI